MSVEIESREDRGQLDPAAQVRDSWAESTIPSFNRSDKRSVPTLSIIAPTYNERANVRPLTAAIGKALASVSWELIFVDDDSPDGTYDEVADLARNGAPVRCIRRIGRRGLASAVVEGAMSASAEIVAVIDADMQHDEAVLPLMLHTLQNSDAEVVVGSRYLEGGSFGDWTAGRRSMSSFATWASRLVVGDAVTDPMSGFFMTRRSVFEATIYDLSQQGYKILLDILTSSQHPLKVMELPYVFRDRRAGESKLDVMIIAEYAFLLIEKATNGLVPPRFVMFAIVGGMGLVVHLATLNTMKSLGLAFLPAQAAATLVAMAFNYLINNAVTYRSDRLKGLQAVIGYGIFCLVCSVGALANISVANLTLTALDSWPVAGIAGALMSSVFNFGVATKFVWGRKRRVRSPKLARAHLEH